MPLKVHVVGLSVPAKLAIHVVRHNPASLQLGCLVATGPVDGARMRRFVKRGWASAEAKPLVVLSGNLSADVGDVVVMEASSRPIASMLLRTGIHVVDVAPQRRTAAHVKSLYADALGGRARYVPLLVLRYLPAIQEAHLTPYKYNMSLTAMGFPTVPFWRFQALAGALRCLDAEALSCYPDHTGDGTIDADIVDPTNPSHGLRMAMVPSSSPGVSVSGPGLAHLHVSFATPMCVTGRALEAVLLQLNGDADKLPPPPLAEAYATTMAATAPFRSKATDACSTPAQPPVEPPPKRAAMDESPPVVSPSASVDELDTDCELDWISEVAQEYDPDDNLEDWDWWNVDDDGMVQETDI